MVVVLAEGVLARQAETFSSQYYYVGANMAAEVDATRAAVEIAAVALYAKAIQSVPSDAIKDAPLHGVVVESRLHARGSEQSSVARFGVNVIVVTTNASRPAVLGLVRAVGAKVAMP